MTTPGSPADKIEPKFKVGDWCIDNEDGTIFQIVKVLDNTYRYKTNEGYEYSCTHYSLENDAKLWTIQDAKDGDVLAVDYIIFIYKTTLASHVVSYCRLIGKEFDHFEYARTCNEGNAYVHPATKKQCDLLFSKMKEAGYEWDAEKKELKKIEQEQTELPNGKDYGIDSLYHAVRILEKTLGEVEGYQSDDGILEHKCAIEVVKRLYEQKPTWSKEDERKFTLCVSSVQTRYNDGLLTHNEYKQISLWLKSLRDRIKGE